MDNERLPIKFFAPREVDELRVEGNRNSEPPKWLLTGQELIDRSAQLWDAFHAFSDAFQVQMSSPIHLSLSLRCVGMPQRNPEEKIL